MYYGCKGNTFSQHLQKKRLKTKAENDPHKWPSPLKVSSFNKTCKHPAMADWCYFYPLCIGRQQYGFALVNICFMPSIVSNDGLSGDHYQHNETVLIIQFYALS